MSKLLCLCVGVLLWASAAYADTRTLQADAVTVGNGVAIVVTPFSTLALEVRISDTARVVFEGSKDHGRTWHQTECADVRSGDRITATTKGNIYVCDMREHSLFRARVDTYTAAVTVHARPTGRKEAP